MHIGEIAVLRSAMFLIERRGWVQGKLCSERGFCIAGAIFACTPDWAIRDAALDAMRAETRSQFVTRWNDVVPKNKREAISAMKRAIARAEMKPKRRRAGPERGSIFSPTCAKGISP